MTGLRLFVPIYRRYKKKPDPETHSASVSKLLVSLGTEARIFSNPFLSCQPFKVPITAVRVSKCIDIFLWV